MSVRVFARTAVRIGVEALEAMKFAYGWEYLECLVRFWVCQRQVLQDASLEASQDLYWLSCSLLSSTGIRQDGFASKANRLNKKPLEEKKAP